MKREWKGSCHVLRLGHFGECHIWLRLLLADAGVATAFAFGGAKSLKRFCGCLDVFNELSCRIGIAGNRDFMVLEEAALVAAPRRLREDWRRMGIATNCLRFTEAAAIGSESAGECFFLVEDLRSVLEENREPSTFLPLFYRLRMAAALGFAPDFRSCRCGASLGSGGYFLAQEGRVFCPACAKSKSFAEKRHGFWLSSGALRLASICTVASISDMPLAGARQEDLRQCGRAINGFVEYQMGLAWENGGFRRV